MTVDTTPRPRTAPQDRPATMDLPGPAHWDRLTSRPEVARDLGGDLFVREGWTTLLQELGTDRAYTFTRQVSLLWLRPDAFAGGRPLAALSAAQAAGFRPLAGAVARLDRLGVRALWSPVMQHATVEGLWLLEAIVSLGPGLVVLFADDNPAPARSAAQHMTDLKGPGEPQQRRPGCLRTVVGSPDRALTMIHSSDDGAYLLRELAVLLPEPQRQALIRRVVRHWQGCARTDLSPLVNQLVRDAACEPPRIRPAPATAVRPGPITAADRSARWAAIRMAASTWTLSRPTTQNPAAVVLS